MPCASTVRRTVSGLTFCASLFARGKSMLTACFITGTVMMKMISSTSITSTSGVMLISFITSSVSSWVPKAMVFLALEVNSLNLCFFHRHDIGRAAAVDPGTRHKVGVQIMGEAVEFLQHTLVAAHQRVVAQHRRNRHCQAERRHDQRLTHRAGHLVDGCLARRAYAQQRVVNAPDRAEQADEGCRR